MPRVISKLLGKQDLTRVVEATITASDKGKRWLERTRRIRYRIDNVKLLVFKDLLLSCRFVRTSLNTLRKFRNFYSLPFFSFFFFFEYLLENCASKNIRDLF